MLRRIPSLLKFSASGLERVLGAEPRFKTIKDRGEKIIQRARRKTASCEEFWIEPYCGAPVLKDLLTVNLKIAG